MLRDKLQALLDCSQSLAGKSRSLPTVVAETLRQLEILFPGSGGYLVLARTNDLRLKPRAFGGAQSLGSGPLPELLRKTTGVKGAKPKIWRVDSASEAVLIKGARFLVVTPLKSGSVAVGRIIAGFRTAKDAERAAKTLQVVGGLIGVHIFNARERQTATAKTRYLREHDVLVTNLPNRRLFRRRARLAFAAGSGSVVFLDLDGFKKVNRDWGYACGDDVLKAVARRWRQIVGETWRDAILARTGGDEFAVLLPKHGIDEAKTLAGRLMGGLRAPFGANGLPRLHASAGVSQFPAEGGNVDEVLRAAETAMFLAKDAGGNRCAVASGKTRRKKRRR